MKDVFPDAKLIGYTEWYYRWENSWEHFSKQKVPLNTKAKIRMMNASSVIGLESLDESVTPTHWQRSVFPKVHQRDSELQFVVVGRPRSAYSGGTGDGSTYQQQALEKYDCDWSRVQIHPCIFILVCHYFYHGLYLKQWHVAAQLLGPQMRQLMKLLNMILMAESCLSLILKL